MIILKKTVVLLCVLVFLTQSAVAFSIICEDFYLSDAECISGGVRALPNTLRLKVFRGETETLTADTEEEVVILWETVNGTENFEIYPEGHSCSVYGKGLGEGTIRVGTNSGGFMEIAIVVEEREAIPQRSFEPEPAEKKKTSISSKVMDSVIVVLFVSAFLTLLSAGVLYFKRR